MTSIQVFIEQFSGYAAYSLLALRLLVGGLFFYSGSHKIKNLKGFAEHNHIPLLVGTGAVLFELIGGLMLILGLFVEIASLMIISIMLGAIYHHVVKWGSPYWAQNKGWEYDLMWLIMSLVILTHGPGALSLQNFI